MRSLAASAFALALALAAGCQSEPTAQPAQPAAAPVVNNGVLEITVTEDGYVPQNAIVPQGAPLIMKVTRKTEKTCATEVVMKDYGINQTLPLGQMVEIKLVPKDKGTIRYTCAMDMIVGTLTVQ